MDTPLERPRWRMTANYRVVPAFQVGAEYNIAAGEVDPLATWFLLTETERRPAVFLGTSSDRIGSPKGEQAYYLTTAKYLSLLHVSPYVSLNYSQWDEGWNVPFGASVELGHGVALRPMYDGQRGHLLGTFATDHASITLLWAWFERAGIAVSYGF